MSVDIAETIQSRYGSEAFLSLPKLIAVLESLALRIEELEKKAGGSDRAESHWSRQAPLESRVGPDRLHCGRTDVHSSGYS